MTTAFAFAIGAITGFLAALMAVVYVAACVATSGKTHPPGQAGHTSDGGAIARGGAAAQNSAISAAPEGADSREQTLRELEMADLSLRCLGRGRARKAGWQ